jgi:hypothetical protein
VFLKQKSLDKEGDNEDENLSDRMKSGRSEKSNLDHIGGMSNSVDFLNDMPPFKIGIIGCGHLGTMILTKLLEIQGSFNNLQLYVSTRQPHLLRPF